MSSDPVFPYISVSYFQNMVWQESRHHHYPLAELERVYKATIDKLTKEMTSTDRQALVAHRSSLHELVKCHPVNYTLESSKKKR